MQQEVKIASAFHMATNLSILLFFKLEWFWIYSFLSEPDMFIVFITSLLLVLPPLAVSVYLWTSVARFYDEIKHYEKALKEISRRHNTMRLVGNLIANNQSQQVDNFSITPRTFNSTNNKTINNTVRNSQNKSSHPNSIVLKKLNNVKETKCVDHNNDL